MTKTRKRHNKSIETNKSQNGWPSWFIEPNHPLEREILVRLLKNNERLSEVHFTVHMMQFNYIVFRRNYEELLKLQKEFDQPSNFNELLSQTDKGLDITQHALIEFTRLLHNFLSSAKMLVDVTRRWVRQQFEDSDFINSYQSEISKRFENNTKVQFLEGLRNFALHRMLPLAMPELCFKEVSEHELKSSLGIVLLKEPLLEWGGWSELGRMQICEEMEERIDIQSIVAAYFNNVTEFTRWLFWQIRDLFSEEVEQINSAIQTIRKQ